MFTPKPHQTHRHSCRLTRFYCSEIPLFLGWLPCIHVTPAHCCSMKSSETAANSPNFPWIRSWHFNERKDNVWNEASSGSLPSMCHSNSTSCPSTQHFILYRPPSRSLNTFNAVWGWSCQCVFSAFDTQWLQTGPKSFSWVFILVCFSWMAEKEEPDWTEAQWGGHSFYLIFKAKGKYSTLNDWIQTKAYRNLFCSKVFLLSASDCYSLLAG